MMEKLNEEAVKNNVAEVLDKIHAALNEKDIDAFFEHLSDTGLFCGTDSKEFWDKPGLKSVMEETYSDGSLIMNYTIDKREIRVNADGNSVLAVEQFVMKDMLGPNLPLRFTSQFVNEENNWKIDHIGWSVVPNNEDLGKLVDALKE